MKRFFGIIIATLLLLGFNTADAEDLNVIIIERTDGVSEQLQLDPAVVVKFTPDFEAYVKALEPSAARNATMGFSTAGLTNPVDPEFADLVADGTYVGAINQLRAWLKKRIEFISDPSKNYGLYNPLTTYQRGTVPQQ